MDKKAESVLLSLKLLGKRHKRVTDRLLTQSTHLSLEIVRRRLKTLIDDGFAEEWWAIGHGSSGDLGPYYRAAPDPEFEKQTVLRGQEE